MIRIDNHLGRIDISENYFIGLIGKAVSECFGVSGMMPSTPGQELRAVLWSMPNKGVVVRNVGGALQIDLHIRVTYGLNIAAIVKSIINKVSYTVQSACRLHVDKVNVFVTDIIAG